MPAMFTHAAVYWIKAVCLTPMRSGGSDGDTEQVLRHRDGVPFLQGTSLAGVLRNWLVSNGLQDRAVSLFGGQEKSGRLIVSDADFDRRDTLQHFRPHLRINPCNAAAAVEDRAKFDTAQIGRGETFHFALVWLGGDAAEEREQDLDGIGAMLSALNSGSIALGALKSNGFGRVALSVQRRLLDMRDPTDQEDWLEWDGCSILPESQELPLMQAVRPSRTVFTVFGSCCGLLTRSGIPAYEGMKEDSGQVKQYTPNIIEGEKAVLPGSSIKGAVRARAESIASYLGLAPAFTENLFGRGAGESDNGLPGQVYFTDAVLSDRPNEMRKIARIRIDRFTGSVIRQGLFNEQPICSEKLTLRIEAPEEDAARGLLLYALRDLGLGLYNLGSGQAIGRGYVDVDHICIETSEQKTAAIYFCNRTEDRVVGQLEDPDGLLSKWTQALQEVQNANR